MTIGVLNIGNTNCEFALFDGKEFDNIEDFRVYSWKEIYKIIHQLLDAS